MDAVEGYRDLIAAIFAEWVRWPGSMAKFKVVPIEDRVNDHYVLLTQGWDGYKRIHGMLAHLDIIDGRIFIQEDNTEEGIGTELIAAGVPKDRIVLAFLHSSMKKLSDFAIA